MLCRRDVGGTVSVGRGMIPQTTFGALLLSSRAASNAPERERCVKRDRQRITDDAESDRERNQAVSAKIHQRRADTPREQRLAEQTEQVDRQVGVLHLQNVPVPIVFLAE